MISANSIDLKGKKGEKVKLTEAIFGVEPNSTLLAQSVRVFLSNQRKAHAKTKTRGEVSKTTAKMYRQKGTGRARHGAYSAPIFVGGGIAFGPTGTQSYKLNLSKKLTKDAILSALSQKVKEQKLTVLSGNLKPEGKTKEAALIVAGMSLEKENVLVLVGVKERVFARIFKNLSNVTVATTNQLNTYLILSHLRLLITDEALTEINKLWGKS